MTILLPNPIAEILGQVKGRRNRSCDSGGSAVEHGLAGSGELEIAMGAVENTQRFPFVDLEKALERARQLYDADQRGGEISVGVAFAAWEYSDKSSGGFQTVAALKMYGIVNEAAGSNESRKIKLSKAGLDYFRDEREDARIKALREFALSPPLFKSLWNTWGASPPSDAVARSHLKVDRGLSEQNARAILSIYKDNLVLAKLKGSGTNDPKPPAEEGTKGTAPQVRVGEFVQWSSKGVDQFAIPRRVEWIADDGNHLRVHGSLTGIPTAEVTVVNAPTTLADKGKPEIPPVGSHQGATEDTNDINVLLKGDRLQISADIDAKGIRKLKRILDMHLEVMSEEGE